MNDTLEHTAQRIADRGRDALVARLRPAFEEAAATHSDVLELAPEQLEQMVQKAADNADGLQWRRALAAVAIEELGIGLGEALSHPAVERAQQIVGAPSYEESLAALGPLPQRPAEAAAPGVDPDSSARGEPDVEDEDEPEGEADDLEEDELEEDTPEVEPRPAPPPARRPRDQEPVEVGHRTLRLAAVHLGGIANLAPGQAEIQLRFSDEGIDVVRSSGSVLGRLTWGEVQELEVPDPRGWRRKRRPYGSSLVLRTEHGDASFEIPALTAEELREHLVPVRQHME